MKHCCAFIIIALSLIAGGVDSFPLAASSVRSSTASTLWLANEGKGSEGGTVDSESDRLLAEIAELTESFEYVQKKNENNKRLYKERIATLQSQISDLQTQLQDAEFLSSSRRSDSEGTVRDANVSVGACIEEGLSLMRIEWEKEKRSLLDEKEAFDQSIANLKQSIHNEAESMRTDMKREYNSLKENVIRERDAALRQSEAMQRELGAERSRRIQLEGNQKGRRSESFWKRLKSIVFRRKRNE